MLLSTAPRQFLSSPGLPGAGLPHDRVAMIAARRAFVDLKLAFMDALRDLPAEHGEWLRRQVRGAEEPMDLWLLRAPVFSALSGPLAEHRQRRRALRRSLATLFPHSDQETAFSSF